MKLIIDGKEYEMDGDFFVYHWAKMARPYIDPNAPEGKKYTDARLAAKGLLRLRLKSILQAFAGIFHQDYHELEPQRGEDMLLKLHEHMTRLMRMEANGLVLEMESAPVLEEYHDSQGLVDAHAGSSLTLTRAYFAGGQEIYNSAIERPDTGRTVGNISGQEPAVALPVPSGGGLVSDEDAPEI